MPGKSVSGASVALMAAGGVIVWSGLNNTGLLETLRALAKGQAPTSNRKPAFAPLSGGDGTGSTSTTTPAPNADSSSIVSEAMRWKGTKYVYGGCHAGYPKCCSPGHGVDCSSYVSCVMRNTGHYKGSGSMVAGSTMLAWGKVIPESSVQPGDVVLWVGQHCGIVVDPAAKMMIAAPHTGAVVSIRTYNFSLAGRKKVFLRPPGLSSGGGNANSIVRSN